MNILYPALFFIFIGLNVENIIFTFLKNYSF